MLSLVWVALGGAMGSATRYLIAGGINDRFHPWGTVLVNVLGSFVLGYLVGRWGWDSSSPQRVGMTVGLLGGFTTFSTFSVDTLRLWENGQGFLAATLVLASIVLGIGAALGGISLGRG